MELTAFHTMPTSLDPSLNITLEFFNFIYSEKNLSGVIFFLDDSLHYIKLILRFHYSVNNNYNQFRIKGEIT